MTQDFISQFPWSNSHELNLDWFLSEWKKLIAEWSQMKHDFKTLDEAFQDLKSFVDNYFKNLDVQDEINHKLDEMKNNGELFALFSKFTFIHFNNVNEMINDTTLVAGAMAITLGYYTAGDGSNGIYRIREKSLEDKDNKGTIIFLKNGLVAEYSNFDSTVTPKIFGALGDGEHDDTEAFIACLKASDSIYIPNGTYIINQALIIPGTKEIIGQSKNNAILFFQNSDGIKIENPTDNLIQKIVLSNFSITGKTAVENLYAGLSCRNVAYSTFTNIIVSYFSDCGGRFTAHSFGNTFTGCSFDRNLRDGLIVNKHCSTTCTFNNCTFSHNGGFGIILNGTITNFFGSFIEGNKNGIGIEIDDRPSNGIHLYSADIEGNKEYAVKVYQSPDCTKPTPISDFTSIGGQINGTLSAFAFEITEKMIFKNWSFDCPIYATQTGVQFKNLTPANTIKIFAIGLTRKSFIKIEDVIIVNIKSFEPAKDYVIQFNEMSGGTYTKVGRNVKITLKSNESLTIDFGQPFTFTKITGYILQGGTGGALKAIFSEIKNNTITNIYEKDPSVLTLGNFQFDGLNVMSDKIIITNTSDHDMVLNDLKLTGEL